MFVMFWIELFIVIICILIGARLKGVGLGIMGGLGLFILTFFFHLKPSNPPYNVLLVIMSVVTAGMALEATGGLGYLTYLAEKIIRNHPKKITFVAPYATFLFTALTGTSHITYSLFPIIYEVSVSTGINPEKPMAASAVAALQAIIASPISAFTALALSIFGNYGYSLLSLLKIYIPSALLGTTASIIACTMLIQNKQNVNKQPPKGLPCDDRTSCINKHFSFLSKISTVFFLAGILAVIVCSTTYFRPYWIIKGFKVYLNSTYAVSIIMLSIASLMCLFCKAKPYNMIRGKVSIAGIQAVIAILGIAWLGNTLFESNIDYINMLLKKFIIDNPSILCFFLFIVNIITTSQAATLKMIIPLTLSLGLPAKLLIGFLPAINSVFFIPNYPTMLAAIEFDKSGSTKIGKFVLNHSFIVPGFVSTFVTLISSIILSRLLL